MKVVITILLCALAVSAAGVGRRLKERAAVRREPSEGMGGMLGKKVATNRKVDELTTENELRKEKDAERDAVEKKQNEKLWEIEQKLEKRDMLVNCILNNEVPNLGSHCIIFVLDAYFSIFNGIARQAYIIKH